MKLMLKQPAPTVLPAAPPRPRWQWLIPALLLSFALGTHGLHAELPTQDEWRTLWHIIDEVTYQPVTWDHLWLEIGRDNPFHTPGYFMLLNGWSQLVGVHVTALRTLTLFAGLLSMALVYRLAHDHIAREAGLIAALLLGLSAFFIRYYYDARPYLLVAFASALTLWAYFRITQTAKAPGRFHWLALFGGALLLLYSHYFAAFLLALLGLYHLWTMRAAFLRPGGRQIAAGDCRPCRDWQVLFVFALAGALFIPWLGFVPDGLAAAAEKESVRRRALDALPLTWEFINRYANQMPFVLLILLAAFWSKSRSARPLVFMAVGTFVLIAAANEFASLITGARLRYALGVWVPLALALSAGFDQLMRWQPRWGRMAVGVFLAAWIGMGTLLELGETWLNYIDDQRTNTAYAAFTLLDGQALPGDQIAMYVRDDVDWRETGYMANYYWLRRGVGNAAFGIDTVNSFESGNFSLYQHNPPEPLRLWLLEPDSENTYLPELKQQIADHEYALCQSAAPTPFDMTLALYARAPVCCAASEPALRYGDALDLLGASLTLAGDRLIIGTAWHFRVPVPPETYSVTFQIFDERGEKVGQLDEGMTSLTHTCKRVVIDLPADLPPGMYQVRAAVYGWRDKIRLPAVALASGETGDLLPVGSFEKPA